MITKDAIEAAAQIAAEVERVDRATAAEYRP